MDRSDIVIHELILFWGQRIFESKMAAIFKMAAFLYKFETFLQV